MRNPHAEGAGASNGLAGHVEDPTRNHSKVQPKLDPIDAFVPGASDDEKALRRRVHGVQGAATARASHSPSGKARTLFWQAAQAAAEWTFAPASKDQLRDVLRACSQMLCAGNIFEMLEGGE